MSQKSSKSFKSPIRANKKLAFGTGFASGIISGMTLFNLLPKKITNDKNYKKLYTDCNVILKNLESELNEYKKYDNDLKKQFSNYDFIKSKCSELLDNYNKLDAINKKLMKELEFNKNTLQRCDAAFKDQEKQIKSLKKKNDELKKSSSLVKIATLTDRANRLQRENKELQKKLNLSYNPLSKK